MHGANMKTVGCMLRNGEVFLSPYPTLTRPPLLSIFTATLLIYRPSPPSLASECAMQWLLESA